MSDDINYDYYRYGKGSIAGFDSANIPNGDINIVETGFSIQELMRYLTNANGMNFPSADWVQRIEAMMREHQSDFNNPHRVTLDQIGGDIVSRGFGLFVPGSPPTTSPFFSFDSKVELPIGSVYPATYTSANLFRRSVGGWFTSPHDGLNFMATDHVVAHPGIPLYSNLTSITYADWVSDASLEINTSVTELTDSTNDYPFSFYEVSENPVSGRFGINIPATQDLQVAYTTSFFVERLTGTGKLAIHQPSDITNYAIIDLVSGEVNIEGSEIVATTTLYPNGIMRISVSYVSLSPVADNRISVIHLETHEELGDVRSGSAGRKLFAIAQPQTTVGALNPPVIDNLDQPASTSSFEINPSSMGAPLELERFCLSIKFYTHKMISLYPVTDPTIFTMGPLIITRDQSQVRVSVGGNPVFVGPIEEGYNAISVSYSPTKVIIKALRGDRVEVSGTFAPISSESAHFGPFGGYLNSFVFYPQEDTNRLLEFLTNG